ncbi:MAG: formylglycine-generating enzyme family protein, partial [Pirellulales bacterium]
KEPASEREASAREENESASIAPRLGEADARGPPFYVTFVVFPPGKYFVGSRDGDDGRQGDERRHAIKITRAFALSDREIAWEHYNPFDGGRIHDAFEKQLGRKLTPSEPAFGVNWFEAVSYCRWLSTQLSISESDQCYTDPASLEKDAEGNPKDWPISLRGHGCRLPTEAEWEVACRGGTGSAYSFGSDAEMLAHYGWFLDNSARWSHLVGQLRPSARGLFDMHGNLGEWCHDRYGEYADDVVDSVGAPTGLDRVYRGGFWRYGGAACRTALRDHFQPAQGTYFNGFR